MSMPTTASSIGLRRSLGLAALTLFGVGDILGAGVYGLVGRIAGMVGHAAWMSYVVAGFMAALTGLTYAELSSRFPRAGGAAFFCKQAFRSSLVTFLVMVSVTLSGLFSMATASRVFADYATARLPDLPSWVQTGALPAGFILILSLVAIRGIQLSSGTNVVCTVIELGGLLAIIAIGLHGIGSVDYFDFATTARPEPIPVMILGGASLAFFAFVGFEDLVNLSEEVHNPERTVPLAICLSIVITGVIYCAIAVISVSVLSPEALGASKSPLLDVVRQAAPGFPVWIYTVIPGFAVFNTALLNLMMSSRLLYGMSKAESHLVPAAFGWIHPRWQTPAVGVAFSAVVVAILLFAFADIKTLASGTATFLLAVFILLHTGLLRIKRDPTLPLPRFRVPTLIPVLGAITGLLLLVRQDLKALAAAGLLTVAALVLYGVVRLARGPLKVKALD
jgi:amino acid transporter